MTIDYHQSLVDMAKGRGVWSIASVVLGDERFARWSGSSHPDQHHYGDGGLLRHTYEVVLLCLNNRHILGYLSYLMPSEREIYLAALFHDYGKIWDYEKVDPYMPGMGNGMIPTKWQGSNHKRLVHHISRSAIEWSRAVDRLPEYRDIEDSVLHAIIAHHGQREWGSPVSPKTRLAWLLHLCDGLSARMNDADSLDVTL